MSRYDPLDEMRDEIERDMMLDNSLPLGLRMSLAKTSAAMRYIDTFSNSPLHKLHRERSIKQRVANDLYDEFANRLAGTSNVSAWLMKRGRTPEVVFLHDGHEVSFSISFRTPTSDEPVPLAWDIRPYKCKGTPPQLATPKPGSTRVETDKGLRFGRDKNGDRASSGGALFYSESDPIETAYDIWAREHQAGTDPHEAAEIANSTKFVPVHRFAPTMVQVYCWCKTKPRHFHWSQVLARVERSLRPGHVRVEDKRIVASLPLY